MARRGPALIPRRPPGDAEGITPAPGELEKVRAFVNTRDIEERTDELVTPADLAAWLDRHGLASPGQITAADLALAIEMREALRGVLRSHVSPGSHRAGPAMAGAAGAAAGAAATGGAGSRAEPADAGGAEPADAAGAGAAALSRIAAGLPAQLRVTAGGRPQLAAGDAAGAGRAGLARILIIAAEAATLGTWDRLKVCGASDCQWAFYDRSPTRSGSWCSMRICGSRAKSRSYRQRNSPPPGRAQAAPAAPRPRSSRSGRTAAPGA